MDQAALGLIVMLASLGVIVGALAVGAITWRRRGRDDAPLLLWIGWRRAVLAVTLSVGAPLAAYAGWVWALPIGSYHYGLDYVVGRRLVEATLLPTAIGVGGWYLGAWAVRRRAWELGLAQPQRPQPTWLALAILTSPLTLLLGVYFTLGRGLATPASGNCVGVLAAMSIVDVLAAMGVVLWGIGWLGWAVAGVKGFDVRWRRVGRGVGMMLGIIAVGTAVAILTGVNPWGAALLAMSLLLLAAGVGVVSLMIRRSDYGQFAASFARTGVPLAAAIALLLAATAGPLLHTFEAQRAQRIATADQLLLFNEVDRSALRRLREHLIHETAGPSTVAAR